jgi:hypothetical protein
MRQVYHPLAAMGAPEAHPSRLSTRPRSLARTLRSQALVPQTPWTRTTATTQANQPNSSLLSRLRLRLLTHTIRIRTRAQASIMINSLQWIKCPCTSRTGCLSLSRACQTHSWPTCSPPICSPIRLIIWIPQRSSSGNNSTACQRTRRPCNNISRTNSNREASSRASVVGRMNTWQIHTTIGIGSSAFSFLSFLSWPLFFFCVGAFCNCRPGLCITTFMSKEHFVTICFSNKNCEHSRYTTLMSIAREEALVPGSTSLKQ